MSDLDPTHITPNADQENVSPSIVLANIHSSARNAMAAQIDGTAKASKRKGAHRERLSDAEKIERVFSLVDCMETNLSLIDDVVLFLSSDPNSREFAIEAIKFVSSMGRRQLGQIRCVMDNTKSKSMAAVAHNKLTKVDKLRASDQQLQRRSLASTNTRRMLQLAISNTKHKLQAIGKKEAVKTASDAAEVVAPRTKRSRLTANEIGHTTYVALSLGPVTG